MSRMFFFNTKKKKKEQKLKMAVFPDCQVIESFLETVHAVVCSHPVWKR